jgi:hypothetical protein
MASTQGVNFMGSTERLTVSEQQEYINLDDASKALGVGRTTLYYYCKILSIETKKFPLDRRAYINKADFERIKEAKRAAEEGKH